MTLREARHSREEFARRGQDIYERDIRPALQPGDDAKYVAIDIQGYRVKIGGVTDQPTLPALSPERSLHRKLRGW